MLESSIILVKYYYQNVYCTILKYFSSKIFFSVMDPYLIMRAVWFPMVNWKEFEKYESELVQGRPGTESTAKAQAVRELLGMLKECQVDEIRRYSVTYVIENDESNKTSALVKIYGFLSN